MNAIPKASVMDSLSSIAPFLKCSQVGRFALISGLKIFGNHEHGSRFAAVSRQSLLVLMGTAMHVSFEYG